MAADEIVTTHEHRRDRAARRSGALHGLDRMTAIKESGTTAVTQISHVSRGWPNQVTCGATTTYGFDRIGRALYGFGRIGRALHQT